MTGAFDQLDDRAEEPEGQADYAPWWDVPKDGEETIKGIIVDVHDEPDNYLEDGDRPKPVYTVVATGEGDFELGEGITTTTHKQMRDGLANAEVGDAVLIRSKGKQLRNDNATYVYEIGVMKPDEWEDSDDADLLEEAREEWDGITGDNYEGEPVSKRPSDDSETETETGSLSDAASFARELVDMNDGEMELDELTRMLYDVRDFDEDRQDEIFDEAELEVDDDTVVVE